MDFIVQQARNRGPIPGGTYRVITLPPGGAVRHIDFPSLEAARGYADDVASEADDEPTLAYVVDSDFRIVERGRHYAARR